MAEAAAAPAALPEGYEQLTDAEGRTYYLNRTTGETSWELPAAPPPPCPPAEGWVAHKDDQGRTFFANTATGETRWECPTAGEAVPEARPDWSEAYTYTLGNEGCESWLEGKVELLDKEAFTSVRATVQALNEGAVKVEAGFCAIFSMSRQTYYLLWHRDREQEAFASLDIQPYKQPLWSERQTAPLGEVGQEHLFEGKAELLDAEHNSVMGAIEALNTGVISCDVGYCVIFSESNQRYFLLWRWDSQDAAFAHLGLQAAAAG